MSSPIASTSPASSDVSYRSEASAIDASARCPVLTFLVFGVTWLLVSSVFAFISSIKLHVPGFLADCAFFTYGRTFAAARTAFTYGWGINGGFAVALWILARLSKSTIRSPGFLSVAACFWNVGVFVGFLAILAGDLTSIEWLEFPGYVAPALWLAFAMIAAWGLSTFRFRTFSSVYISQWYILIALFAFPWIFSITEIMAVYFPARGTVQALVSWWYAHNLLGLWFAPIALASIYYFLPKILGRPVSNYYLASLGLWTLVVFVGWSGPVELTGGPVPTWVQSAGVVSSILLVVSVLIIGINHYGTLCGGSSCIKGNITLRFTRFSIMCFTLAGLQGGAMALRNWSVKSHFTYYTLGHNQLWLYGFFTMAVFGAIYYILPRLTLKAWPSSALVGIHFSLSALGLVLGFLALTFGGLKQGTELNDGKVAFEIVMSDTSLALVANTVANLFLLLGHLAFAINAFRLLASEKPSDSPVLFLTESSIPITAR